MSTKLQRHKLSSLIDVKRGQSISGEYYASEGEHIRLTLANFDYVNGGFKADSQKDDLFYTGPIKPECLLNEGDIITPLTEQALGLLGSTARIPESGKYVQSGDIALVTCKEGLLDPNFCYYLLPSKQVKKQLAAGSQQTKIRHTSPDAIKACVVDIPDFEQQKKIGKFLSLLDRNISLNRAINQNLEALAKQIYDYWFVQFDFPDENGRPYKSSGGQMVWNDKLKREIPAGWDIDSIGNILDKYESTKRYETKEYLSAGKYPIVDQGDSYIVGYTNESDNLLRRYPAILFGDHSTRVKLLDFPFARGADGTQILYSNNSNVSQYYLYLYVASLKIPNPGYSRHFKYLKDLPIIIPALSIVDAFTEIVKPIYLYRKNNIFANISLSRQRDELLPLLMNGQVTIE